MKLISWNVNGLRACVTKGFYTYLKETNADIFCVQETKLQEGQILMENMEEYTQYWNYAEKKDIPARLFSPKSSRSLCIMDLKKMKNRRAEPLLWNSKNFISSMCTHQIPNGTYPDCPTDWNGKTVFAATCNNWML